MQEERIVTWFMHGCTSQVRTQLDASQQKAHIQHVVYHGCVQALAMGSRRLCGLHCMFSQLKSVQETCLHAASQAHLCNCLARAVSMGKPGKPFVRTGGKWRKLWVWVPDEEPEDEEKKLEVEEKEGEKK